MNTDHLKSDTDEASQEEITKEDFMTKKEYIDTIKVYLLSIGKDLTFMHTTLNTYKDRLNDSTEEVLRQCFESRLILENMELEIHNLRHKLYVEIVRKKLYEQQKIKSSNENS